MMQGLWSRVAQVRGSCRCPQCLSTSTTSAVSRRAAASATRRMPQYWTSSTLWYSGIFAAAATFDAGIKVQRREKWEQAITELKDELGQAAETEDQTGDVKKESSKVTVFEGDDALRELEADLDSSSRRPRAARWPSNTGPQLDPGHLPPQSIYSPRNYKVRAESLQWSDRKLEVMQLSMDLLQLRLWHSLNVAGWAQEAADAVPSEYADNFRMTPEHLFAALVQKRKHLAQYSRRDSANKVLERPESDIRLCKYSQDNPDQSSEATRDLNTSLRRLFRHGEGQKLSVPAVLAKVYYNLSISPAPPSVDTFNTLITGLSKLRQDARAREVIAAFKQTFTRPNEVSLASILDFYTNSGDARSFRYWVHLMRGKYGGLMKAHGNVRITASSQGRLIRDPDNLEKIIQLPYPTPMVFAALIRGVLRFSGFDVALKICEGMSQERWGISISGMETLLKDCADCKDWASGLAIWHQIQALKEKSWRLERGRRVLEVIDLRTYATMLRLCSDCDKTDHFGRVMTAAIQAHPKAVSELSRTVRAEQQLQSREHVKPSTFSSAETTFKSHNPNSDSDEFSFSTPWMDLACEEGSTYKAENALDASKMTTEIITDVMVEQAVDRHAEPIEQRRDQSGGEGLSVVPNDTFHIPSTEHRKEVWRPIVAMIEPDLAPARLGDHYERSVAFEMENPMTYAM